MEAQRLLISTDLNPYLLTDAVPLACTIS